MMRWTKLNFAELTVWIFFIFRSNKIRVSPTIIVSSLSPPRCCLSSDQHRYAATSCHTSFSLSKNELTASALSFGNALSRRFPSRYETEALNLYYHHRLLSSDCLTPTLYWYKKIILTLITLSTTQPCHHFTSRCITYIISPHNDTHDDKLDDSPLLLKFINTRIHVKKYFKVP
jgi:hypothetical protein